jgi:hypothetical protein
MEFLEYMISLPSLGAAALVTIGNIARILIMHNKNNVKQAADTYVSDDNFEVLDQSETYVRTYETKVKVSGDKK